MDNLLFWNEAATKAAHHISKTHIIRGSTFPDLPDQDSTSLYRLRGSSHEVVLFLNSLRPLFRSLSNNLS